MHNIYGRPVKMKTILGTGGRGGGRGWNFIKNVGQLGLAELENHSLEIDSP